MQSLEDYNWTPDVVIIGSLILHSYIFFLFLDEAAQCTEPQAWAAILKARRCILVGDHAQLPPSVKSEECVYREIIH